jgi:PKHD-type hydroxylase
VILKKGDAMFYYFNPLPLANYSPYAYYDSYFTSEECDRIKALWGQSYGEATTAGDATSLLTHIPNDVRKTEVDWIGYSKETDWLYNKLYQVVMDCNLSRYGFELTGFTEKLQLTHYRIGDHYGWHQDNGGGVLSNRKLSLVVQLSEPSSYEGGELEFLGLEPIPAKKQGTVILFPSYNAHQVTPVTKGERWSLVAWVRGPAYR